MSDGLPAFSLVRGGPFYRLLIWAGILQNRSGDPIRASAAAIALTWLPFLILSLVASPPSGDAPELWQSFGVHARLLVAIPAFLFADASLHMRMARCVERLSRFPYSRDQRPSIARITIWAGRMRDSPVPETVMLLLALGWGQSILWGIVEPVGTKGSDWQFTFDAAALWYSLVALPLFDFLTLRWLWRWGLWALVLFRLSRLPIRPIPTHPDERGGLEFLSEPSVGVSYFILGSSAVLAGAWATRIVFGEEPLQSFTGQIALWLVAAILFAFGPVASFTHCLWLARFQGMRSYGELANDYTGQFHRRWIDGNDQGRGPLLGTSDIQSLADLANSYNVLRRMKILPISKRSLAIVAGAALAPVSLLLLTEFSVIELLQELGGAWLGPLPQ